MIRTVLRLQVLELLQCTSLSNSAIALTLPCGLQPLVLPDLDNIGAAAPASAGAAAASGSAAEATTKARPGTGQKGAAGKPGAGEQLAGSILLPSPACCCMACATR